ncbi:hypothetical protein [Pendulispora albinea]|uniref:Uncharacterized protein n=1 Tax=Pendulispora albinea TaxID=2741071 RepID=A0ABZ2MB81_9BACT
MTEFWLKHHWPTVITCDRYGGVYSGAAWIAFPLECIPEAAEGDDNDCAEFWQNYDEPVGKGATPDEALSSLIEAMRAKLAQ